MRNSIHFRVTRPVSLARLFPRSAHGASFVIAAAFLLAQSAFTLCHANGSVLAWGATNDLRTAVPADLGRAVAIAGGDAHSIAVRTDGTVRAWGLNVFGQADVPAGLANAISVAAGSRHSMALLQNGTIRTWGDNSFGQTAIPAGLANVTAIAAGWTHSLALRQDGTVVAWGTYSNVPPNLTNVIAIAAGDGHSLAALADGRVIAWGDNTSSKTNVPTSVVNAVSVAAGKDHSLALLQNGRVRAWGNNTYGQTSVPSNLTNVIAIAAGARHSMALRSDGTLAIWGDNSFGQSSQSSSPQDVIAIAAGAYHTMVIRGDGAPVILVQPASQSAITTRNTTLQVFAVGARPLGYQWQKNEVNIAAATGASYILTNVKMSDAGSYRVVISNAFGVLVSDTAVITPTNTPPIITVQPQNMAVVCGDNATLQVTTTGTQPVAYEWYFEGLPVPDATNATLNLVNFNPTNVGTYYAILTNEFGSVTSAAAAVSLLIEPPTITSAGTASAKQGFPFSYQVTALHTPSAFASKDMPPGLEVDPVTGEIFGIPLESGVFNAIITAFNACTNASRTIVITVSPSIPAITSGTDLVGVEGEPFSYQITATENPTGYTVEDLPAGLLLDGNTGLIAGAPVYAGTFYSTIAATNDWGMGTALLRFTFTNAVITNLAIANVTYNYSTPYLLDFEFSLLSPPDTNIVTVGNPVVVDPRLLSVTCYEDDKPISASETAVFITRGSTKQIKAYLVLDFSQSIASLANGDTNANEISDAVETMVASAQSFVNQQPIDAQIGVYEFHRDDADPQQVVALTSDKELLNASIAGIWTNYVNGFPAASRCWDALTAAIEALGETNRDEQHYVVFVSDGVDESSIATVDDVITAATNANVKIFCAGFGAEVDATTLEAITTETSGRYYTATTAAELATDFAQIGKDVSGQYILRWATLKRSDKEFMPKFEVSYQGWTAYSPTNPVTPATTNVDDTTDPPTTNITEAVTNYIIGWYKPTDYAGPVSVGSLRLVPDAEVLPTGITLRAAYVPRYIRQIRLRYQANWPCTYSLQSTNAGELLDQWSLTETNDESGGTWLILDSPPPHGIGQSLPFASFGKLITFRFRDVIDPASAFSIFEVDNTIYQTTGGQSFEFENVDDYIEVLPQAPLGTPVPWLIDNGFTSDFEAAELSDPDGDGVPTWQEYQANTDPNDKDSAFLVREFGFDQYGRRQLTFPTSLNRFYRVEYSEDLVNWAVIQENIPGTGGDVSVVDPQYPTGIEQRYYRLSVY